MIKIGNYNTLTVARDVDFGLYLTDGVGNEVLLPRKFVPNELPADGKLRVFVYTDSEDRPIATTVAPYAVAGEFAFLQVKDVNATGAFLDWGVEGKDLLVPFAQQKARMLRGGIYPVYVYLDRASGRVIASAKIEKFLDNVYPDYHPGSKVRALILEHTPIGFRAIVDNAHRGMIYDSDLDKPLELQQTVNAYVRCVRDDGRIDLSVAPPASQRTAILGHTIMRALKDGGGRLALSDASSPEEIHKTLGCSKKDFKKAIGHLYHEGRITIGADHIELAAK